MKLFRDWLLERNKQKAEKLEIICNLTGISLDATISASRNAIDLLENEFSFVSSELISFLLENEVFFTWWGIKLLKSLFNKGYLDKSQYNQYLLEKSKTKREAEIFSYLFNLVMEDVYKFNEIKDVFIEVVKAADYDYRRCVSDLVNRLYNFRKITYSEKLQFLEKLKEVKCEYTNFASE